MDQREGLCVQLRLMVLRDGLSHDNCPTQARYGSDISTLRVQWNGGKLAVLLDAVSTAQLVNPIKLVQWRTGISWCSDEILAARSNCTSAPLPDPTDSLVFRSLFFRLFVPLPRKGDSPILPIREPVSVSASHRRLCQSSEGGHP